MKESAAKLRLYSTGLMPAAGAANRRVTITDEPLVQSVVAPKEQPDGSVCWSSVSEKRVKLAPERAKNLWAQIDRLRLSAGSLRVYAFDRLGVERLSAVGSCVGQ